MFQAVKWLMKMHRMELCPRNGERSVLLTSTENCECTYVCIYIVFVCVYIHSYSHYFEYFQIYGTYILKY